MTDGYGNGIHSVLAIKHGALGDVVLAHGCLHDIRAAHPQANITVLTTPAFAKLFSRCPYVDEVLTEQRAPLTKLAPTIKVLRMINRGYDRIYDLMCSDRTLIYRMLYLGTGSWHYAPGQKAIPRLNISDIGRHGGSAADAVSNCEQSPSLAWLGDDCNALRAKHGIKGDYIVLVPGCSKKHLNKRWPHHGELALALTEAGHTVVMAPGPDEMSLQLPAIKILHEDGSHLDIFALTGLLQGAKLVVGNDTGPVHIAAASGIPTIMVMQQPPTATFAGLHRDNMKLMYKSEGGTLATEVVTTAVMTALQTT